MAIRVMIVEDHEELQIMYRAMFRKEPDLVIVSQEDTAEEALRKIPERKPDVVIVDISLPGMNGLELTNEICRLYPEIKILVVTGYDVDRYMEAARIAGADNLITKSSAMEIIEEVKRLKKHGLQ